MPKLADGTLAYPPQALAPMLRCDSFMSEPRMRLRPSSMGVNDDGFLGYTAENGPSS